MKITVLIFVLLAIIFNDVVIGEPITQNIKENIKNSGLVQTEIIIGGKNPKRDSSDQTAVQDKTGQSQNNYQQPQVQYQSIVPVGGQYYASAAAQQVQYTKPEGGIEYAKAEGGIQYASSTQRPAAAYQTISYSAHHNGAQQQQQQQHQQQQNNGKLISQIAPTVQYNQEPVQYNHAPVQYYTLPQQNHHQHQIQYAIAVPSGNGHHHHQQIAFAALPNHGYHGQPTAQIAYLIHPHIQQHYRGDAASHYSTAVHSATQQQQHQQHQVPQFAIIAPAAHHHSQIGYAKLPTPQQAFFYAAHPGQNYFASQPTGNLGYYQHHSQPQYQHLHQPYALAIQPSAIQYSPKPLPSTTVPISVTQAPVAQSAHYKNYVTTSSASNSNHHNGATSFASYSAQLPLNQHYGNSGSLQVIKAPVTYATTPSAPVATYQHNGGTAGGKIYYAAIPAQYQQDAGQVGYTQQHGAIHYGQHLYHPSNSKVILSPTQSSTGQKYQ